MRPTILTLALLTTTTAIAQTTSTPPTANPQIIQLGSPIGNCPVGLFAQRQSAGQTIWTISAEDAHIPSRERSARTANSGVNVASTFIASGPVSRSASSTDTTLRTAVWTSADPAPSGANPRRSAAWAATMASIATSMR